MFLLGEHVRGDEIRPGGRVGHDQHFTGAGQAVDAHPAVHLPFGFHHIRVTRPADDVHSRHRLGSVGHGGNGLRPAHAEYLLHPHQTGGRQHRPVDRSIPSRRRADDEFLDPGHQCRHRVHDHRGGISAQAAGHVQPRAVHRQVAYAQRLPLRAHVFPVGPQFVAVEERAVVAGGPQSLEQLRIHLGVGRVQGGRRHGDGGGTCFRPVEAGSGGRHSGVAPGAHVGQDRGHSVGDVAAFFLGRTESGYRPLQSRCPQRCDLHGARLRIRWFVCPASIPHDARRGSECRRTG